MTDNGQEHAVATRTDNAPVAYGDKPQVSSLAARIMRLDPAAKDIGEIGVLLKAQLGIALGLNPLPGTGHIHVWKSGGALCVHVGLEGRMALARQEAPFSVHTRPMTPAECDFHSVIASDRGAVAEVFRIDLTQAMAKNGIPVRPAIGIGIARGNETAPRGRSLGWRAEQRAIKDALRLVYGFRLPDTAVSIMAQAGATFSEAGPGPDDVIEGEFAPEQESASEERKTRAQAGKEALFGDSGEWKQEAAVIGDTPDDPPIPIPPEVPEGQVALPWASMLLVAKDEKPNAQRDAEAFRVIQKNISPATHLKNHPKPRE